LAVILAVFERDVTCGVRKPEQQPPQGPSVRGLWPDQVLDNCPTRCPDHARHRVGYLCFRVFPGTSNSAETPGKTQDTLEGLYLPAGLGTPRDPPE